MNPNSVRTTAHFAGGRVILFPSLSEMRFFLCALWVVFVECSVRRRWDPLLLPLISLSLFSLFVVCSVGG